MDCKKTLVFGLFLAFSHFLQVFSESNNDEDNKHREAESLPKSNDFQLSDELKGLVGKTLNFSYLARNTHGVQLTLLKKPVNFDAFTVDDTNVKQLNSMLRGRNVSEFFYVASHVAGIEAKIAEKAGDKITTLELETIFSPDEDTVYSAHDVDELVREITEDPSTLDLNHGPSSPDLKSSDQRSSDSSRPKRKAVAYDPYKWPTTIYYVISNDFDNDANTVSVIKQGIKNWEEETCIQFNQVADYNGPHLIFRKLQGCWSKVGMQFEEFGQYVSIGVGCEAPGIVAHEVGHALGFHHEHQRPDRDRYVTINYQNIMAGRSSNFLARQWQYDQTKGVPYDYSSIMQYVLGSFSSNGQNTISVNEEDMNTVAGSQYVLSFYDVKLANLMYCTDRCTGGLAWSACQNDGYRDPKDCTRCKCPDGWTGTYCTEIQPGVNVNCGSPEIVPTRTWKTLSSPNYFLSAGLPANAECTWRIKTNEENKKIVVRFKNYFRLPCNRYAGPCESYIEIRHKDMAKAGPRYCCNDNIQKEFVSHGKEILLLLRSSSGQYAQGFQLEYRTEPCGCSANESETSVSACIDTQRYSCPGSYRECPYQGCAIGQRENTCYKEVRSCCGGFVLNGDTCFRRLSSWSDWSTCSKTCGSGTQSRTRTCDQPPCSGQQSESRSCNDFSCNEVDLWSNWSSWTSCSATCGPGYRTRNRNCLSQNCRTGSSNGSEVCNLQSCDGGWSNWFAWSGCTRSCGTGFRVRNRVCYRSPCSGSSTQTDTCNTQACSVGGWSEWAQWSSCTRSCGDGTQSRTRTCLQFPCSGTTTEARQCNNGNCPVPAVWSNWNNWSTCSVTCGAGIRSRTRTCPTSSCGGSNTSTSTCFLQSCPVPGIWSSWNNWSRCSVTCGPGTRTRTRTCPNPPCSGFNSSTESCYESVCPGQWTNWYSWSGCSTTCGPGSIVRSRMCLKDPCSGDPTESKTCNNSACPAQWNNWNQWSVCSATCGSGTRNRVRTCQNSPCSGATSETQTCNTNSCPANIWSTWSSWTGCSRTCGSGSRTRTRSCVKSPCSGATSETQTCNTNSCPANIWSTWSSWTGCSRTCGSGSRTRTRSCIKSPCSGPTTQSLTCTNAACPVTSISWSTWNQWSPCSGSCGTGHRLRVRACFRPPCSGSSFEVVVCNVHACPSSWANWTQWSSCTRTCGSGTKTRSRACSGSSCSGTSLERQSCNTNSCQARRWCTSIVRCDDSLGRIRYCLRYSQC